MKLATVVVLLAMSTPALADGPYAGGFFSGGAYGEMGRTGPNSSRGSTMLGGFAGYGFQAGGLIISPEVRVYGGLNHQKHHDHSAIAYFPTRIVRDRLRFKETAGASVGMNIGIPAGEFSPYAGASVGVSRLEYGSLFTWIPGSAETTSASTATTFSVRAGTEYDFDRYFVRAEIEQRWFKRDGWKTYRKTEASLGFGVRF